MRELRMKLEEMPRQFGTHLIVDVRNGNVISSQTDSPYEAMAEILRGLGREEFEDLPEDVRAEMTKILAAGVMARVFGGSVMTGSVLEVINLGPLETLGGSLANKNMDALARRFLELADQNPRPSDSEIAVWYREQSDRAQEALDEEKARAVQEAENPESGDDIMSVLSSLLGGIAGRA
jgi:hypothetical protein